MLRSLRHGLFVALCVSPLSAWAGAAPAIPCDRTCLAGLMTGYVDALVAHDPRGLPLVEGSRVTENSKDARLGEGIWQSVTGKATFRQDYLDVRRGIAAAHVVLPEGRNQLLASVLLRVKDRKITGIESLVQRITPDSRFQPTMLGKPLAGMNDPVPEGGRDSRETMIRTALTYTEGLRIGSFVRAPTPFSREAYRIENGVFMAGKGCPREQCPAILTQSIMEHPDVSASVAAVDEENGVVLLWMNFGDTNSYGPGNALVTFEAFKVWAGQIQVVHAFFPILPVATQRGWPSADPVPPLNEYRVKQQEDIKAIERVLLDYGRSLDQRDFATYSALFAREGEWKGGMGTFKGPAKIKSEMERIFGAATGDIPKGSNYHIMSNFIIDVRGDHATADSMFTFYRLNGNKPEPAIAGRYEDVLVREDGEWKFLTRNARNP